MESSWTRGRASLHPHPLMKRFRIRITLEQLWTSLPFFLIVVKGFLFPLPLLDFWWHLKLGEIIVSTRSIPRVDLFSFTAAGKLFIVQNWLAEIVFYLVYRLGGFPMLVFLNAVLMAAALLPIFLICRESTSRLRLAVLATFLTSILFFGNLRPQVFSFILFSMFFWVLEGYRFGRRDKLWLLPLLMVVWVNTHGAFVLGLGLTALYFGCELVRTLANPGATDVLSGAKLRKLGVVLPLSAAATLLNPETWRLYDYVRTVMADQASQKYVMEWQPPRINTLQGGILFFVPFFLVLFVLSYSRVRPGLTDFALVAGFAVFGLTATRNSIWFCMIMAPILVRHIGELDLRAAGEWWRRLIPPESDEQRAKQIARNHWLNFVIAFVMVFVVVIVSPWIRPALYHTSLLEAPTPVRAMDFIERRGLQGNIFHPQILGDYLIWRLYPRQRSCFDGRVHLFGESLVKEFQLIFDDSHWEEKLAPYNIRYLLLSKAPGESEGNKLIQRARDSGNWTVLFEDDISILFARKHDADLNAVFTKPAGTGGCVTMSSIGRLAFRS